MESRACITLILVLMLVEGSTGGDWESALWHQYFNARSYTQLAKRLSFYVVFCQVNWYWQILCLLCLNLFFSFTSPFNLSRWCTVKQVQNKIPYNYSQHWQQFRLTWPAPYQFIATFRTIIISGRLYGTCLFNFEDIYKYTRILWVNMRQNLIVTYLFIYQLDDDPHQHW